MSSREKATASATSYGLSFGTLAAAFASYLHGNSFGWILIHGIFGWLYIIYLCAGCGGGLPQLP